jgi:DNA polymerase delta subunit 1
VGPRSDRLQIGKFALLGRIRTDSATIRKSTFSSKAYGTRENKVTTIDGRVQFDMLTVIQRDHKLSSYTLNSVSAHFLGADHVVVCFCFGGFLSL